MDVSSMKDIFAAILFSTAENTGTHEDDVPIDRCIRVSLPVSLGSLPGAIAPKPRLKIRLYLQALFDAEAMYNKNIASKLTTEPKPKPTPAGLENALQV